MGKASQIEKSDEARYSAKNVTLPFLVNWFATIIQWRKNSLFSKWCWDNWMSTWKRMKWGSYFTPNTQSNSKWIKDQDINVKTTKFLQENIGVDLHDLD